MLDRRLEWIATILFAGTLVVSIATLVGLATDVAFVNRFGNWFTLVSAGFPALGTAVFGIQFQGDFGGDALRSLATANTLRQIEEELSRDVSLSRAADLTEQAGKNHARRPRRMAAGQPAARPVGRLAYRLTKSAMPSTSDASIGKLGSE